MSRRVLPGRSLRGGCLVCTAVICLAVAADGAATATSVPVPSPLLFIYGAQAPQDILQLPDLGVTALYLDLEVEDLSRLADLNARIALAADHGLKTILAIPTVPRSFVSPPSVGGERYRQKVVELITAVIGHFRDNPHVVAWATGDYLERHLDYNAEDLRTFLRRRYGNLQALNDSWGTDFGDWGKVSREAAQQVDDKQPFGVGRALVDEADFRRQAFHDLLTLWAETIRALDTTRPLLTGRISLYRDLLAVPPGYDAVCPFTPPDELEPDLLTHNVHAVDMARGQGQRPVVPCLRVPVDEGSYTRGELARWIALAALHGAVGIGLDSWDRLQTGPAPRAIRRELSRVLRSVRAANPFRVRPRPTIAFLYEPYGSGLEGPENRPAYGYIPDFSPGEPTNPFAAFRLGTRFGLADYLSLDDLPLTDLSRYGVLFAPLALRLPDGAQRQLAEFVRGGGALVADLGLGVYETGSWLMLPEQLGLLCGIRRLAAMQDVRRDLTVSWVPPWLPSLPFGARTQGCFASRGKTLAPGQGSYTGGGTRGTRVRESSAAERVPRHVVGPACRAALEEGTGAVATLDVQYLDGQRVVGGLMGRQSGQGVVCFATHRLWANWVTSDPVYMAFHGDLCARRAAVELLGSALWTEGVCVTAMAPRGIAVVNARAVSTAADVLYRDAAHALYTDAWCLYSAEAVTEQGLRSGAARLSVVLPPLSVTTCQPTPILVQPFEGTCLARLLQQEPTRLVLQVAGDRATLSTDQKGNVTMGSGVPTQVRFTVRNGIYRVHPGSVHRVTQLEGSRVVSQSLVTASGEGELRFSETIRGGVLSLEH